jgi:DNA-binding NtrC family response regulator
VPDKWGHVLVVDDDEDVLFAAELLLSEYVAEVRCEPDPSVLPELASEGVFDVVLLDMNFTQDVTSGQEGFHWLGRILEVSPDAVVVLITAYAEVDTAARAVREGASDFVVKPWENEKLVATVLSALSLARSRKEVASLKERQEVLSEDLNQPYQDFVGESPAIQAVRRVIEKVSGTDANVLITGENGTGKELVARAVHRQSERSREAFVTVDVGALTATLFESEVFGHVKGAFTDAKEDRPGRFELASGGTILLDEIGNLPLDLQSKLLSVLETRTVTRVGSSTPREVDVRVISATNVSLPDLVAQGRFRQDLLYRINTVEIPLPPLRERPEDIPLLVGHFLDRSAKKYKKRVDRVAPGALARLEAYRWPGNVRELAHAVERAVIMTNMRTLRVSDFALPEPRAADELPFDTFNLEEIEEAVVRRAMVRFEGNVSRVARELGLSRPALYRRLKRYGL